MKDYNLINNVNKIYNFINPKIMNSKMGIVKDLFRWIPEPDDPKVFVIAAISSKSNLISGMDSSLFNSGAGLSLKKACFAAVGESVERYACTFINESKLFLGSYNDLIKKNELAPNPSSFAYYNNLQYKEKNMPFNKFTKNTKVRWTPAINLLNNKKTYIPAANVYLPYYPKKDEKLIWYPVSTGLACGDDIDNAILNGIYEVIERDAFSILWLNHLSMPLIDLNSNKDIKKLIIDRFHIPNCKIYMIDMTNDTGVPSVLGILSEKGHGTMVSAATRYTKIEAVKKALIELAQGRITWKKDFVQGINKRYKEDFSDVTDFNDHVNLYTKHFMKNKIKFAFASKKRVPMEKFNNKISSKEKIKIIINKLKKIGFDVFVKDLTTDDIKQCGYKVVRVVIPGMTEISNDQNLLRLGGDRIFNVPVKMGYRNRPISLNNIYRIPHPFP